MPRLTAVLALLVALAACGPAAGSAGGAAAPTVVAAVYPLAWVAEQVAPGADITLLNAGGGDAHDLEITPARRAAIETADVVLYMGDLDYQPQVEAAVAAATGAVIDVADVAGDRLLDASADAHDHGADSGGTAVDPHVWFDMTVMADVASLTGDAVAAADPGGAEMYAANAQEAADLLTALDDGLDDLLAGDCRFDEVVVSHVAYSYLTEPRNKDLHGITGIDPEAGASGGQLGELVNEIREQGFRHVLAEPVEGRADAEALARETGVELLEIRPLDTVSPEEAAMGFPALVREQARTLATAYGCS